MLAMTATVDDMIGYLRSIEAHSSEQLRNDEVDMPTPLTI